ncbi:MAG: glycosyltransferase family 39 protein [Planctomycetes bacterium]|nr:glycosyltransferase family 39 protein [Planctomycetota bacterium]
MPADTQTNSARAKVAKLFQSPWFLALLVTMVNAVKPVLIDDTAYLTYARHISEKPLDPYGFRMFWWTVPSPAMSVLVPPVLPYWLAINIAIFGEHPWLLKLWLYPLLFALAWSVRDLLRRFARGTETRMLPLLMLSPAVLPTVNLMLDVPALALGLSAVAVFMRAADRGSWRLALTAGLLAALAMQTKYTALLIPPAVLWYGLTHRRIWLAVFAVGIAASGFVAWELFLVEKYYLSHFLHHALVRETIPEPGESLLEAFLREKSDLGPPLAGHLGCLGIGVGLVMAAVVGVRQRTLVAAATVWLCGFVTIVLFPPERIGNIAPTFWQSAGWIYLFGLVLCANILVRRFGKGLRIRWNADTAFLVGWVLIEVAGYFVLTPFGAARRVIALTIVGGLLTACVVSRVERIRPHRRPPGWVFGFGIAAGFAVTALDTFDAYPEKVCAERAASFIPERPSGSKVWSVGHWGFQYYCERAGMTLTIPARTIMKPGDILVLPIYPNHEELFRPHAGEVILPPSSVVEPIAEVVWDDAISGQTIPSFYCGASPIVGRTHPRLRVMVYRVTSEWGVPRN